MQRTFADWFWWLQGSSVMPGLSSVASLVDPSTQTASFNGTAIDMTGRGVSCVAIESIGTFQESNSATGHIEESDDGVSGWVTIAGTTFTTVTEGANIQFKNFTRTKRYLRFACVVSGLTPEFLLSVALGVF